MKSFFLASITSLLALTSVAINTYNDTTLNYSYGWMIFINEDIIWVPAPINEKTKPDEFFLNLEYNGGLIVSTYNEAPQYRKIAKSYSVGFGSKRIPYTVALLPVKVSKKKSSIIDGSDTLVNLFMKTNHEVYIRYQFATTYYIREILLIRKCDMRKYRKNKKKSLGTRR